MNSYQLTPSEMLCAFLDGELESGEAEILFLTMAQSPDLQAEMREYVILRNTVQAIPLFTPPEHLKAAILEKVGLAEKKATPFAIFAHNRAVLMTVSAIISSILTLWMINSSVEKLIAEVPNNESVLSQKIYEPKQVPKSAEIAKSGNFTAKSSRNLSNLSSNFVSKPVSSILQEKISAISEEPISNVASNEQAITPELRNSIHSAEINSNFNQPLFSSPATQSFPLLFGSQISAVQNFTLNMRSLSSNSMNENNLSAPLQNSAIEINVALLYRLSENDAIGVEFGRENFLQQFTGTEKGLSVRYEQSYSALCAGASFQHKFDIDDEVVEPFTRMMIGGTSVGPLGKCLLGLGFSLSDEFTVSTGIEASYLLFQYQQQWFSTQKLGVVLGTSLKF